MGFHTSNVRSSFFWCCAFAAGAVAIGIGCTTETTIKRPDGTEISKDYSNYPEHELPWDLAWVKLDLALRRSQGWAGQVFDNKEKEMETRLTNMRNEARKGQTGSSPTTAFEDMVPEIASWIAVELPKLRQVQTAKTKQILIISPVANQLGTGSPGSDIEAALATLGTKLLDNEAIRNNFIYLASTTAEGQKARDLATGGKPYIGIDPMDGSGGVRTYSPNEIFLITPRIFQSLDESRGMVKITMDVRVQHPQTQQDLRGKSTSRTFYYQPYSKRWLSKAENDALQTRFTAWATK